MNHFQMLTAYSNSHIHNTLLETLLYFSLKKPTMIGRYAGSPITRERGIVYGNVIVWKQSYKTVRIETPLTLY